MYQKVILIGHLGRDPELRYTSAGKPVVNMSIATTSYWYDNSGQKQTKTEWHRLVGWDKIAENCANYLQKGSLIQIEGKLQTRSWENNGQTHYVTEINIKEFNMLDKKSPTQNNNQNNYSAQPNTNNQHQQQNVNMEDDIPF